jgi:hypothetical protein
VLGLEIKKQRGWGTYRRPRRRRPRRRHPRRRHPRRRHSRRPPRRRRCRCRRCCCCVVVAALLLVAVEVVVLVVVVVMMVVVMMVVVVVVVAGSWWWWMRLWFVIGCTSGWLIERRVSRDVGIIYFLNNAICTCPVSSAGWRVGLQRPKGSEFDSRSGQLFL